MAEILIIVVLAVLVVALLVFGAVMLWRPAHGDDSDRFTNARRITTTWAADAGTDLAHPTPGQPGTVDTSPEATEAPGSPEAVGEARSQSPSPSEQPPAEQTDPVLDLRRQTAPRPARRPPRA